MKMFYLRVCRNYNVVGSPQFSLELGWPRKAKPSPSVVNPKNDFPLDTRINLFLFQRLGLFKRYHSEAYHRLTCTY
jgi:hypothetical protein